MKLALVLIIPWLSFNAFLAFRHGIAQALIAELRHRFTHRPPEITRETLRPR